MYYSTYESELWNQLTPDICVCVISWVPFPFTPFLGNMGIKIWIYQLLGEKWNNLFKLPITTRMVVIIISISIIIIKWFPTREEVNPFFILSFQCGNLKPMNPEGIWMYLRVGRNFLILMPFFLMSPSQAWVWFLSVPNRTITKTLNLVNWTGISFLVFWGFGRKSTGELQRPNI